MDTMNDVVAVLLILVIAIDGTVGLRSIEFQSNGYDNSIVKTIQRGDGDIIDCFDVYKQPSVAHPLLKNHKIQMKPRQDLSDKNFSRLSTQQTWKGSGGCPKRTVPILRNQHRRMLESKCTPKIIGAEADWAVAYNNDGPYVGVSGKLILWNPHTEDRDSSLSFAACGDSTDGTPKGMKNAIVAGWDVLPWLYGDNQTRFFIARTAKDGVWCFVGHECANFIQVNKAIGPGIMFSSISSYGDPRKQSYLAIDIYKDLYLDNWWVAANGNIVGYFPVDTIGIQNTNMVTWGGMVHKTVASSTPTQMGSGHFTEEGFGRTGIVFGARVKRIGIGDVIEPPSGYFVTRPLCYDLSDYDTRLENIGHSGYYFMYGGPGSLQVLASS